MFNTSSNSRGVPVTLTLGDPVQAQTSLALVKDMGLLQGFIKQLICMAVSLGLPLANQVVALRQLDKLMVQMYSR